MRDSKRVEIHRIDACLIQSVIVFLVEEDLLESPRLLCQGRSCGHEPAVTEGALDDIVRRDPVAAEEGVFVAENLIGTRPADQLGVKRSGRPLTHVPPIQGARVMRELTVIVGFIAVDEDVEVIDLGFVTVCNGVAGIAFQGHLRQL